MVIDGDFALDSNLDLNGHKLTINGSFYHCDGSIIFNGGRLEVKGIINDRGLL